MAILGLLLRAKVIMAWANMGTSKSLECHSTVYAMIGAMFQLGSHRAPSVFVCYTRPTAIWATLLILKYVIFSLCILLLVLGAMCSKLFVAAF